MKTVDRPFRILLLGAILIFAALSFAQSKSDEQRLSGRGSRGSDDKDRPSAARPASEPRTGDREKTYRPSDDVRRDRVGSGDREAKPAQYVRPRYGPVSERDRKDVSRPGPLSQRDRRDVSRPDATSQQDRRDVFRPGSSSQRDRRDVYRPDATSEQDRRDVFRPAQPSQRDRVRTYRPEPTRDEHRIVVSPPVSYRPDSHVVYRPPRYVGGRYHYYGGWPYQYDFPCAYGYWAFDYVPHYTLRSTYFYYGCFPYIPVARVIIIHRPVVAIVEVPIVVKYRSYYDDGYYLARPRTDSVERALSDIRRAWVAKDPDLLLRYAEAGRDIDVLLDGDYAYSLSAQDYRSMTRDAISSTDTIDFEFDSVRSRGDDRVIAYGHHEFYSPTGMRKMVYVSYLLERRAGEWIIIEVGSSEKRLDR